MGNPCPRPKHLAAKLLAIRKTHGLTQRQLGDVLKAKTTRISDFELGKRLPNLLLLVAYARLGDIPMEFLVLDGIDVPYFTQYVGARHRGEVTIPIILHWPEGDRNVEYKYPPCPTCHGPLEKDEVSRGYLCTDCHRLWEAYEILETL